MGKFIHDYTPYVVPSSSLNYTVLISNKRDVTVARHGVLSQWSHKKNDYGVSCELILLFELLK